MNESESLERPRANSRIRAALWIGGALVALALVFCAGVVVGGAKYAACSGTGSAISGTAAGGKFWAARNVGRDHGD